MTQNIIRNLLLTFPLLTACGGPANTGKDPDASMSVRFNNSPAYRTSCSGNIDGFTSDVALVNNCILQTVPAPDDFPMTGEFMTTTPALGFVNFSITDIEQLAPDMQVPLNYDPMTHNGNFSFGMDDPISGEKNGCASVNSGAYPQAPDPGMVIFSFTKLGLGESFVVDIDGPIACSFKPSNNPAKRFVSIHAHIQATWQ